MNNANVHTALQCLAKSSI